MKTQQPIRAVIVEDEPLARQTLKDFLAGETWLQLVGEAADGDKAVKLIDELCPDLIFLDVKMPGLSGLQVLERINHEPEVVFTTAYEDHAVTAFELEAIDYVLKPFGRERFRKVLERVRRRLAGEREASHGSIRMRASAAREHSASGYLSRMFVRDARGRIVHLQVTDITRLAGADDYVELHANNASYLVNITLNEFEERLDPMHFRRIHRSAIVNLDHMVSCTQIDRRFLLKLSDGSEVMASRSGSQALRALLI